VASVPPSTREEAHEEIGDGDLEGPNENARYWRPGERKGSPRAADRPTARSSPRGRGARLVLTIASVPELPSALRHGEVQL
jgi:hypothetical protein